jgi:hypothetical protein
MKTYSLVGMNPTKIIHKGTINGTKPKVGTAWAEPIVTGGKAEFLALTAGGLFAFDKKTVMIDEVGGGAFTIVDPQGVVTRPNPTSFPFRLLPNEWLKFAAGTEVWCIARLDVNKVY